MAATVVELGFAAVDKHVLRFEWPILILVAEEEEPLAKYCLISVTGEPRTPVIQLIPRVLKITTWPSIASEPALCRLLDLDQYWGD
jgi:hypothetical protein